MLALCIFGKFSLPLRGEIFRVRASDESGGSPPCLVLLGSADPHVVGTRPRTTEQDI